MAATISKERECFPNFNGHGFWLSTEIAGLRRDQSNILGQMAKMNDNLSDIKVQVAGKLDKDEFHSKLDQLRDANGKSGKGNSKLMEVIKILASSLAAALSALTGVKLLE